MADNIVTNPVDPTLPAEQPDKDFDDLRDFRTARVRLQRVITDFVPVSQRTYDNRNERYNDINLTA